MLTDTLRFSSSVLAKQAQAITLPVLDEHLDWLGDAIVISQSAGRSVL
jgi:hypothetical protein